MFISGGFAGHGAVHGVTVTPGELRRTCNDCRYSWAASKDQHTRRSTSCIARQTSEATPVNGEPVLATSAMRSLSPEQKMAEVG